MPQIEQWQEYLAQAIRFAQLSHLASEHAKQEIPKFPKGSTKIQNFETFEAVAIGVCHGFALEMLIKGIRNKHKLSFIKEHDLWKLMDQRDFCAVRQKIERDFSTRYSGLDYEMGFSKLLNEAANLFESYRYHFEGKVPPRINADFTSYLYFALKHELESPIEA